MSLVGNLEDLGLGEILQIVSLSRKSGVLTLESLDRQGKIYFADGQVTRACVNNRRENLGEVLVHRGVASVDQVVDAAKTVLAGTSDETLAETLAQKHGIPQEKVEEVAKETVEEVVYNFFAWEEGTFSFALGENADLGEDPFHPLHNVFESGLNPQWLAMEGSRILDEKRHRGEATDDADEVPVVEALASLLPGSTDVIEEPREEVSTPVEESQVPSPGDEQGTILYVIDDDEATREALSQSFSQFGLACEFFADTASYIKALSGAPEDAQVVAMIDLIMPRADGSGILGGLELLEAVRRDHPALPVIIISDHANPDAAEQVKKLGVADILIKPKKSEVTSVAGREAIADLTATVVARLNDLSSPELAEKRVDKALFNLGEEMRLEFGESDEDFVPARGPQSPGLHLLRGMLAELQNPALGGGIILLVLRFASELMNRAVIFVVKDTEVSGLGQFGIESSTEPADVLVRKMSIPRGSGSVFDQLVDQMAVQRVKLGDSEWDTYLRERLGGGDPEEVFLGPIISEGKVVAILYGDNLPEQSPVGDTESLEIFLSQAGIAMEKALLERRLRFKSDD